MESYTPSEPSTSAPEEKKKNLNVSVPAAIVTGAAIVGLAILLAFGTKNGTAPRPAASDTNRDPVTVPAAIASVRADDFVRGDATKADIVVIEYSDSDCPFCQQFHTTMQNLLAAYNGTVAWVYRHYPLTSLHPNAFNEALALSCVGELGGQKAFWLFLGTVITTTVSPNDTGSATLTSLALQSGVDGALYIECIQSKETKTAVEASIAEAQKIGARGTPFSIAVNQKTGKQVVIPGAVPVDYLKQTIDSLLK